MSTREAYQEKLQSKLDQWGAQIDKLKAKAEEADANAKLEYHKQIDELRTKKEEAGKKLDEFKQAGEDAWEDLKGGMESAWDSLGDAVESATSRFK